MLVCEMERRAARRQLGMTARTVGIRELVIMVGELGIREILGIREFGLIH